MNPQDSQMYFWVVVVSLIGPIACRRWRWTARVPGRSSTPAATSPRRGWGRRALSSAGGSRASRRRGSEALEVLLVRRTPAARFMGGVWVFPGGAVDAGEDELDAALRELEEEAAIEGLARDALVRFSQWITPAEVKIRFDTHFFLAPVPDGAEPAIDGEEIVDHGWFSPRAALEA